MSEILRLVRAHNHFRARSINLLPSENILSTNVKQALGSDLASRYSLEIHDVVHGEYVDNAYFGTKFSEEISHRTTELACKLFGADYAVTDALSGHIAAMTVLLSTMKKGDMLMAISAENGGYDGYMPAYLPEMLGYRMTALPFDNEKFNLSHEAPEAVRKNRPAVVVVGASYILFPYPLKELREACDDVGATLIYDASHVLGLIAGKRFQPEAVRLCHVVYGSTHKSFPGPQGGLILTTHEEIYEKIRKNLTWRTIDNPHLNRIAALGVALEEMLKSGRDYAGMVVENAKVLGKELHALGVHVRFSPQFTLSHQLLLDGEHLQEQYGLSLSDAGKILEENAIIIDAVGRIGTAEITRIGMKTEDMPELAALIHRTIKGEDTGENVIAFRRRFKEGIYTNPVASR